LLRTDAHDFLIGLKLREEFELFDCTLQVIAVASNLEIPVSTEVVRKKPQPKHKGEKAWSLNQILD
jgi:hypothetical protein